MRITQFIKYFFLTLIIIFGISESLVAQDYKASVGIRLGTHISVSGSYFLSGNKSVELIAGIIREANQSEVILGSFYKMHFVLTEDLPTLNLYVGGGVYVIIDKHDNNKPLFAPSAILGMEYTLENAPVNFFLDVSPNYKFHAGSKFNIQANMGVRYVFGSIN